MLSLCSVLLLQANVFSLAAARESRLLAIRLTVLTIQTSSLAGAILVSSSFCSARRGFFSAATFWSVVRRAPRLLVTEMATHGRLRLPGPFGFPFLKLRTDRLMIWPAFLSRPQ